jgi:hypothetical protein
VWPQLNPRPGGLDRLFTPEKLPPFPSLPSPRRPRPPPPPKKSTRKIFFKQNRTTGDRGGFEARRERARCGVARRLYKLRAAVVAVSYRRAQPWLARVSCVGGAFSVASRAVGAGQPAPGGRARRCSRPRSVSSSRETW